MNDQPKVLLCQLAVRKSARTGKSYLSGWLGRSRLIGFQSAEPDRWGNVCFDLFVQAVEDRREPQPQRELLTVDADRE